MKTEIIPAILPKDFAELTEKVALMKGFAQTIQIDVCDGQFTPVPSWPYRKRDDSFERIMHEEQGLPGWEDAEFEIDLMANKPEDVINDWVQAGAARIILHVEARGNLKEAIALMRDRVEIGMALNIETPVDLLAPYAEDIAFIQCMGIDRIGYQHQAFDPKVVEKIAEIRKKYPNIPISIDGGVSLESAPRLIEAGAARLVIGSAIFDSENPIDAVHSFNELGRS